MATFNFSNPHFAVGCIFIPPPTKYCVDNIIRRGASQARKDSKTISLFWNCTNGGGEWRYTLFVLDLRRAL